MLLVGGSGDNTGVDEPGKMIQSMLSFAVYSTTAPLEQTPKSLNNLTGSNFEVHSKPTVSVMG